MKESNKRKKDIVHEKKYCYVHFIAEVFHDMLQILFLRR